MSLTDGSVRAKLLKLWLPMIGGVIAVKSIDLADVFFIGQLGPDPLAAISFTFPVVMTLISISIGLGAGASSVLSRAIGDGAGENRIKSIVTGAAVMAFVVSMILTVAGWASIRGILQLMGARGEVLEMAHSFMCLWFLGVVFLVVPVAFNGMLRATGDSRTPAFLMSATAVLNIALDPIFIFGLGPFPALGMDGAVIATIIARVLLLVTAIRILFARHLLTLDSVIIRDGLKRWRAVARVGLPASLSTSLNPIAMSVITAGVATLGNAQVAALGVATTIQSFALVPMIALAAATSPFAGQNSGAGKTERTREALYWACAISFFWASLIALLLWLTAPWLVTLFDGTLQTREAAVLYLSIVPISCIGYGVLISVGSAMNGLGRAGTALFLGGGRAMGLLAPAGYLGAIIYGFEGMAWGVALANIIAGVAAFQLIRRHPLSVTK